MTKVAIVGAAGRMGRLLMRGTLEASDLALAAALEGPEHPDLGTDAGTLCGASACGLALEAVGAPSLARAELVIDFSLPEGTRALLQTAQTQALVVGVTGLETADRAALSQYAQRAPVVVASNFSTGINVLVGLVSQAAAMLPDHDLEIVEMHHNRKQDAPSGTAHSLARAAAEARGQRPEDHTLYGRQGNIGPRVAREIGVHALRGGDVAGEHTVYLAGAGERLALGHLATSRQAFADGALRAARWVVKQPPGLYSMQDVMGFSRRTSGT